MGRLQGVAIRKPGDLPAVCTGRMGARCREESAVRFHMGWIPRFSAGDVCLCFLYASEGVGPFRERFFAPQNGIRKIGDRITAVGIRGIAS